MLAYRTTWIMKQGRIQEALELMKAEAQRYSPDYAKVRVYTPNISREVLVWELVVENEEAHEEFFADFNATPGAEAFWEKWREMPERATGTERWDVTDLW